MPAAPGSPLSPAAADALAEAARRLGARRDEFTADLLTLFAKEIAPLQHDDQMLALLAASTDENVIAGLHMLEHGIDPSTTEAPVAAIQYARRLAQRGIPVAALLRAYRLGHAGFVEILLQEITGDAGLDMPTIAEAGLFLTRTAAAYVDRVCELVVEAYESEREAWARQHSVTRAAAIQALLSGRRIDVRDTETALGYRLTQTHLAALLWLDAPTGAEALVLLERVAAHAAGLYGSGYVFSVEDEASAAVWFAAPADTADTEPLRKAVAEVGAGFVRAAVGGPGTGPTGFRNSYRQARAARSVALAADGRTGSLTEFSDVGGVALLCSDLEQTRLWVGDTLGPLATDEDNVERLRETVRVFLAAGSSYTAAAEQLHLHKNTVQYRVQKAEQLRGRPFKADRLDVELALRVAWLLGPAVLRAEPEAGG